MAGMVQGDVQIPAFRGIDLGEPGRKVAVVELQFGFAESKATAGLHQSVPTFIHSVGDVDGSFQLADGEVSVQGAAEYPAEDHVTSGVEFLISKVLDSEPDEGTEGDEDDAGDVVGGGTQDEGETGDSSGSGIEDIGDAAGGEAAGEETMVDMAAIRAKDGLATEKAARDGEGGIEEGDGEGEEGSGHAEEGGGFLGPDDAEASQEEANGNAAAIAHKDGGVGEVIGEKTEEGAEEGDSDEGQGVVASEQGAQEGGGGGEEANTYGEAIEAIDEVEGIGAGDEPKHGEGEGPPGGGEGVTGDGVDLDIGIKGKDGGEDLTDELHPGFQAEEVIEETGGEGDENGGQESPHTGKGGGNGARAPKRRIEKDEERDRVTAEDGDTAGAGNWSQVDLTRIGLVKPAQAGGDSPDDGGEGQGE